MYSKYSRARIDDKQVTELIGILKGIIADGTLDKSELEMLVKWQAANPGVRQNPVVAKLYQNIDDILSIEGSVKERIAALVLLFTKFTGSDFEIGEDLKATAAFFCNPVPPVTIPGRHFCFTGTFLFGSRRDCESAINERGGFAGSLTKKTDFLVVGEYATESWIQPSFGRKVEKALELQRSGTGLAIVSETDWRKAL